MEYSRQLSQLEAVETGFLISRLGTNTIYLLQTKHINNSETKKNSSYAL